MSFRTHQVFTVRYYEGEEKTPAGSQSFSERDRAMAFFLDKKEVWDNMAMGLIEILVDLPCSHMILASGGAFGVTMLLVAVIPSLFATWWFWGR